MTFKTIRLTALAAFAVAVSSMPVAAQEARLVGYADLDLSHAMGVARLDSRIASAVRSICRNGDPALRAKMAERRCTAEVQAEVRVQRELAISGASRRMADMVARDRIAAR